MNKMRLICVSNFTGTAEHVGGPPEVTYQTFDIDLPQNVADWLAKSDRYNSRFVHGVEILAVELPK